MYGHCYGYVQNISLMMTHKIYLTLLLTFITISVFCNNGPVTNKLPKLPASSFLEVANIDSINSSFVADQTTEELSQKTFHLPEADLQLMNMIADDVAEAVMDDDKLDDILIGLGNANLSDEVKAVREAIDIAISAGNFISTLTGEDLVSLPLVIEKEIGNTTVNVVFNSMELLPAGAKLEVFAGITIPQRNRGEKVELFFAASDIIISKDGGIVSGGTLGLLNDVAFELGGSKNKAAVVLNKWEPGSADLENVSKQEKLTYGTFINIGCDGFEEFGVSADIHFSRDWVVKVDDFGNVLNTQDRVQGHFELYVQDWNNLLFENLELQHFALASWQEMTFAIGNANIDLSDYRNPASLPTDYLGSIGSSFPNDNTDLWRGVYIERVEITMPRQFKKNCDGFGFNLRDEMDRTDDQEAYTELASLDLNPVYESIYEDYSIASGGPNPASYEPRIPYRPLSSPPVCTTRLKIGAEHLLIDKHGVSGDFYIGGEAPLIGGAKMDQKWSWSLDYVEISLLKSKVDGFAFEGLIAVPIMKKNTPLAYEAHINFFDDGHEYYFEAMFEDAVQFPLWNAAQVSLEPGTTLSVSVTPDEFVPTATINATVSIGNPADYQDDDGGSPVKIPELNVTGLRLQTVAPYIGLTDNGSIGFTTGDSKVLNFPVTLNGLEFENHGDTKCALAMDIGLNLMEESDQSVEASGGFKIIGKLVTDVNGAHLWVFDKLQFTGASVEVDLPAFKASGDINIFDNHPIYGKGFSGTLSATIMGGDGEGETVADAFELEMAAIFGSKDSYRYFLVDAFMRSDAIGIPIPPTPLLINGFGGGAFYHMKPTGYAGDNPPLNTAVDASGLIYQPTINTKFGIKFAVGLTCPGNTMQGKLTAIIRFDQNLALQNITFWGVMEFIKGVPPGQERTEPEIQDEIADVALSEEDMHSKDQQEVEDTEGKIVAQLGLSFDFDGGFDIHGYAGVFFNNPELGLVGSGQLDLVVAPGEDKWHLYVGGYSDGSVKVEPFFSTEEDASMVLYPATASMEIDGIELSADAYFLTGNDLPGPPPIHPEAAAYFGESVSSNRDKLNCAGRSPASATGLAFGASTFFSFKKKVEKKILGVKIKVLNVDASGGIGFDIALLKYDKEEACSENGQSPQGINGFRATGLTWAFVDAQGKVLGIPFPALGVGVKLNADVVNPSYFDATVVINFIKKFQFGIDFGEKCGHPCAN